MSHLDDFLDLYPNEGPDAGTGPLTRARCATCGHRPFEHSTTGCMVIVETQMMRADGAVTVIERPHCRCWGFKK